MFRKRDQAIFKINGGCDVKGFMPLWRDSVRNRRRNWPNYQLSLQSVPQGVGRVIRHQRVRSGVVFPLRHWSGAAEGMGVFTRKATLLLRPLRFADSKT